MPDMKQTKQPPGTDPKNGKSKVRLSKDTARLVALCDSAVDAGSRTEEQFWSGKIELLVTELMERGNDVTLEAALEHTHQRNPAAHEILASSCEAAAETCQIAVDGGVRQALLVSIPLIVWSKYLIPSGDISEAAIAPIRTHLFGHILSHNVSVCINPFFYAIDHLPRGFSDTRKLLKLMANAAIAGGPAEIDYSKLGGAAELPADVRFILAVVVAKSGEPFFQWQEVDDDADKNTRANCLDRWNRQSRGHLAALVPGCEFEAGLPNAFFANCRESDLRVRPHSLAAVVSGMATLLETSTAGMAAVVAGVGDGQIDEYRVSITRKGQNDVLNGVVWPLYGEEDDDTNPSPRHAIETLLKDQAIGEVTLLDGVLPPEYCDDCGAPLFYTHDGEAVHAEMPEDVDHPTTHFH